MSEYWKSLPKKFCDACKCWFADNKASIDFHEKGKRHRENVQKRLNTLMRKGQKEYEAQQKYEAAMKKIEKEALKAFAKDVAVNPSLVTQYGEVKAAAAAKKKTEKTEAARPISNVSSRVSKTYGPPVMNSTVPQTRVKVKRWYEAKAENGGTYYWNSETGDSQWETPDKFVSLTEQEKAKNVKSEDNGDEVCYEPTSSYGPAPMFQPYGQWTPVVKKKEKTVDLQLPECQEDPSAVTISISAEEPSRKFKEKVVGNLAEKYGTSNDEGTVFKKRKNVDAFKRNIRRRDDD